MTIKIIANIDYVFSHLIIKTLWGKIFFLGGGVRYFLSFFLLSYYLSFADRTLKLKEVKQLTPGLIIK